MNPIAARIISIFDSNSDDQVSFKQFLQVLSVFSPKGNKEEKMQILFKAYDVKGDGFIDSEELHEVLKMMVGSHLTPEQLQSIVEKTISEADKDGDGKVSFKEFCDNLKGSDVDKKMVMQFTPHQHS
eukprot:TRINITY_DN2988_c0_g1_i2.p1 TRINITY_DN2988_c0_g1~~TRINITY_DN2988_c0_g1_i2.p1  ORF type:complete len:127 (+),score=37.72 TRINITY_DN2988_c0_g1_i2:299-679(+)